jgi:hypothetical protein
MMMPALVVRPTAALMSSDEQERAQGRLIEPLRIVDDAEQRRVPGCRREQVEPGESDQKAIGRTATPQPERGLDRVALRLWEALDECKDRKAGLCDPANGHSISDSTPLARSTRPVAAARRAR